MKYLDLTLGAPQEDLACDEAFLQRCEDNDGEEVLRFWEPRQHFVVLGYSSRVNSAVHLSTCRKHGVPVLRRCSGGGTVLQGPGCLNYTLILRISSRPILQDITKTNTFIMERLKVALEPLLGTKIRVEGFTDLALRTQKFSGNSQYRKRRALLFHGAFLLNFDISLIAKFLPNPPKHPPYRKSRPHEKFLTNLNIPAATIKTALKESWSAAEEAKDLPFDIIATLVREKYSSDGWNLRF
jgi:lipoate-protein ligase A